MFFFDFWNCFNFANPLSPPVGAESMQQSRSYLFHESMNSFSLSNDRICIYVVLTFMLLFPNSFKFGTFTIESWRIPFPRPWTPIVVGAVEGQSIGSCDARELMQLTDAMFYAMLRLFFHSVTVFDNSYPFQSFDVM